jgi:beta-lactamase class C
VAVGFGLWRGSKSHREGALQVATAPPIPAVLPQSPRAWHGRIDYRILDARIRSMMADPSMQGLAIAVVEDGRLAFVRGYGRTAPVGGDAVGPETVFRWASLSKTVASTLTARLASDGMLSLTDPLEKYGTSLRLPGQAEKTLTVEALLSQRTGLPRNAYDGWLEGGRDPKLIRESFSTVPLQCQPGTCHSYQNVAFDTITEIIERATRRTYADLTRQRLFTPLGMTSTSMGLEGLQASETWAQPSRNGRSVPLSGFYYRVPAAAGVNSNIVDLARWMQAQMGLAPGVLTGSVLSEVQRPRVNTSRPYGNSALGRSLLRPTYGLGMRSFTYRGHRLVGHSGAVTGYRSTMMFDPETRTGVVMLWNSEASLPFRLQPEIFDLAYHQPFTDWLELKTSPAPIEP